MSDQSNPATPVQGGAAPAPAAAAATGSPSAPAAPGYNAMTTIGSLGELKEKAPEVYNKMMEGIAMGICNDMKDHQERIKKIMREGSRDAEGKG